MIELVATILILGIALTSIAFMMRLGTSSSADTLLETRAIALGYSYLDEILGRRFDERSPRSGSSACFGLSGPKRCSTIARFGTDGGEGGNRSRWDDVDDYHGLAEGDGEASALTDAQGNVRNDYANFRIAVNVSYAGTDTFWGSADITNAKLVVVAVSHRSLDQAWSFSAYKGNY